jgi:RNA polymerase sigma-70 factor (ECF subfamily)
MLTAIDTDRLEKFGLYPGPDLFLNVSIMDGDHQKATYTLTAETEGRSGGLAIEHADALERIGNHRDREAFIELFEYFAPRIKSYLLKGGMAYERADDVTQDVMLNIWQKAHSYDRRKAAASTWIFTIARNKRIDVLRKAARPEPDPNDPLMTPSGFQGDKPEQALAVHQNIEKLMDAIDTLPEEQAGLLRTSFFEDKTHIQIAEDTGIPLGTVKSRIRLAIEKLRHMMEDDEK